MDVFFSSNRLKEKLELKTKLSKEFGSNMHRAVHKRLNELNAAPNLQTMRGIGNCHELKGNAKGIFAIDLIGGDKLAFKPIGSDNDYMDGNAIIWSRVTSILVIGIGDYH